MLLPQLPGRLLSGAAVSPIPYPRLVSGVSGLPDILKEHGCSRVLIVTDPDIHRLGLTCTLENALTESKISFLLYDRTAANPTSDNVEAVRTLCLKHHCDAIIGFGGGSSMDCAKAAGARIVRPGVP